MPAIAPRAPYPLKTAALGGLMAMAQVAVAQQADVPTLPDVTVGSTLAPSTLDQTPASITVVDGERARDRQWQVNLSEALPGVPGLLLQNRQNYAQDQQLSIRGHGARSTFGVRGCRFLWMEFPRPCRTGRGRSAT